MVIQPVPQHYKVKYRQRCMCDNHPLFDSFAGQERFYKMGGSITGLNLVLKVFSPKKKIIFFSFYFLSVRLSLFLIFFQDTTSGSFYVPCIFIITAVFRRTYLYSKYFAFISFIFSISIHPFAIQRHTTETVLLANTPSSQQHRVVMYDALLFLI